MAPFMPFTAEMIYQKVNRLRQGFGGQGIGASGGLAQNKRKAKSEKRKIVERNGAGKEIVELGHRIRKEQNIK